MIHTSLKAGAVLALGTLAFASPAFAMAPHSFGGAAPLVILAQDEENQEVWQDLRPDVTPPEAAVGEEGEAPQGDEHKGHKEGSSGGDAEEQELKESEGQ